VPFVIIALLVVLAIIALIPLSIVQRFRVGTSRRMARGWVATINLLGVALSVALFLTGAALTNVWVPDAFVYSVLGLCIGCLLGVSGLALTRWSERLTRCTTHPTAGWCWPSPLSSPRDSFMGSGEAGRRGTPHSMGRRGS
jgi:hypothetical protein